MTEEEVEKIDLLIKARIETMIQPSALIYALEGKYAWVGLPLKLRSLYLNSRKD